MILSTLISIWMGMFSLCAQAKCNKAVILLMGVTVFIYACGGVSPTTSKPVHPSVTYGELAVFLSDSIRTENWDMGKFSCQEPNETVSRNLPYSFSEALLVLDTQFVFIDTMSMGLSGKQYAKALIVADFVYAAFSFQFLGPQMGLANDASFIDHWDELPLEMCYEIGNTNHASVYCEERTSFYLRLVDTLLNIKGTSFFVENVHTFPVLFLEAGYFMVDPYDPFVVVDASNRVVDYPRLYTGQKREEYRPIRTKRLFGHSNELVSKSLYSAMRGETDMDSCFCCALKNYLKQYQDSLTGNSGNYDPKAPYFGDIKKVSKGSNAYSMTMIGRVDGHLRDYSDVLKYYVATSHISKK